MTFVLHTTISSALPATPDLFIPFPPLEYLFSQVENGLYQDSIYSTIFMTRTTVYSIYRSTMTLYDYLSRWQKKLRGLWAFIL